MRKTSLRGDQMSDGVYVDAAAHWAKSLVARESRGPGDTENAMRRVEQRYGVPFSTLWALRYRKPKGILVSLYVRLHGAYRAECERQMRLLQHDIEITEKLTGPYSAAVRAAKAVVGESESEA